MTAPTVVISAWETISPLGWNAEEHARNLRKPAAGEPGPRTVAGFDVRQVLGPRGTRAMCRGTGLAVATTGQLLARVGLDKERRPAGSDDWIGVVLATSDMVQPLSSFNTDSWTRGRPYDVDPAQAPSLLMNVHSGHSAIWHRLRGPNSTICGSHLGSLLALSYARRLLHGGHARAVLCGAVEEHSEVRAAYTAARAGAEAATALGEGCVAFLLESAATAKRPPLAEVVALNFGFAADPDDTGTALTAALHRALETAGAQAAEVSAVALGPGGADTEVAAIRHTFGDVRLLSASADAVGDTESVSGAFQIAEILADPRCAQSLVAATSTDSEGRVGCALLRVF
ncbi:beta-ketoacyl synthase N-terminal-like domain-containing protein [Actinoplanes sp. NPDC051346]|uniref:beta-ketoacyl synthase N-terminal-like domain-containing protein n=1 Tax=Actinoplanes sp. NPDC051346 TaxID=3155048 RepID=UPI003426116D